MYGSTFTLIFKVKRLSCGAFDKAKSRLVAGGHRAIEDVHYFNSSSHLHGAPIVGTGKIEEPVRSKNVSHVIRLAR